jgi:hypothetical protein
VTSNFDSRLSRFVNYYFAPEATPVHAPSFSTKSGKTGSSLSQHGLPLSADSGRRTSLALTGDATPNIGPLGAWKQRLCDRTLV